MSIEFNSSVTSQVMELKTPTPGVTRKEEIKTGFKNVDEYSKYLQEKYSYMNKGTTSMQGIPTTVEVSPTFLKQCMDNPKKAKYLEENLAAIPDCVKSAVNGCQGTLTNLSYQIDANGNMTIAISGTNDPDGKIARENAERKAKENREKQDKLEEKRQERAREHKEQLEQLLASKKNEDFSITITGTDVKEVTSRMISAIHGENSVSVFDIRA